MILLDAVNLCLRYIGEMPVPEGVDIDTLDELHEAKIIRREIGEKSKELQTRGWWYNREAWTFIPDSINKKVQIPVTVLSLKSDNNNVVERGGILYDLDNNTYEFEDSVECEVIWEVDFENLPFTMASYIAYSTARDVQSFLRGDVATDKRLEQKVGQAYLKLQREDLAFNNYNLISGGRLVNRTTKPTPVT